MLSVVEYESTPHSPSTCDVTLWVSIKRWDLFPYSFHVGYLCDLASAKGTLTNETLAEVWRGYKSRIRAHLYCTWNHETPCKWALANLLEKLQRRELRHSSQQPANDQMYEEDHSWSSCLQSAYQLTRYMSKPSRDQWSQFGPEAMPNLPIESRTK
jgi:hypothetical protein